MQQLYIPRVGDHIRLTQEVTVTIQNERRNNELFDLLTTEEIKIVDKRGNFSLSKTFVISSNTVLMFDRLYIRHDSGSGQGETGNASSYDSITFVIKKCSDKTFEKKRFWIKLEETRKIFYEKIENITEFVSPKKEKPIKQYHSSDVHYTLKKFLIESFPKGSEFHKRLCENLNPLSEQVRNANWHNYFHHIFFIANCRINKEKTKVNCILETPHNPKFKFRFEYDIATERIENFRDY